MTDESVKERVDRERIAHEEDDVLANSARLKSRFQHTLSSPAAKAMEWDFEAEITNARGQTVLDYGCGNGEYTLALLKAGAAEVHGIDISQPYVERAADAARQAGFPDTAFKFQVMDAHELSFDDNMFDLVLGRGILHHLDIDRALSELERVLKPGGRAVLLEPLAGNPLLKLFRVLTPAARTADERPLSRRDLDFVEGKWIVRHSYYGLCCTPAAVFTSVVLRPYPDNFVLSAANALEQQFARSHILDSWHQYVLLRAIKPSQDEQPTA